MAYEVIGQDMAFLIRLSARMLGAAVLLAVLLAMPGTVHAERIKDIASFEGVRDNQLIGYGLVVGLDGTGDKGVSTMKSIANLLTRMGLAVDTGDISAKNTAAVIITATLPPFPKPGIRLDGLVSTIADAKSLQGGTLLMSPMKGPDGKVYALAQGPVSIGGFTGGGDNSKVQKNHPTTGNLPAGVIVEREPKFTLGADGFLKIFLHRPDFTTASGVAARINEAAGQRIASTLDPSAVRVRIPEEYAGRVVEFVTMLENVQAEVDEIARVIINERTGTVVIGENVKIAPVAIAHGNLTIEIKTDYRVSQPLPFSPKGAQTVVTPSDRVSVREDEAFLMPVSGVTLGEIIKGLNALGVTPRDLIAILQALRAAGALRAELEII